MNAILAVVFLAAGGDLRVEPLKDAAPRGDPAVAGLRVLRDGAPFADFWIRATPGDPRPAAGVLYPTLTPGALVGLARYHQAGADYKNQKVPAGLYALRYMVQPDDGDHQDATPSRDFLVLCPADADPGAGAMEPKAAIQLSATLNGKKHPSVLYLVKGEEGALPRVRRDEKAATSVLELAAPLRMAVVIEGASPDYVRDDAADFAGLTWIDEKPDLKGKVVLVRWWTSGCALCSGSAPALAELGKKAAVVAVYHPKPPRDVPADAIRAHAKAIGMPGTLAFDRDWAVLDRWMPPGKRSYTSLTFVLDKKGRVRHVHPGGTIDEKDAATLSQQIDALLAEK